MRAAAFLLAASAAWAGNTYTISPGDSLDKIPGGSTIVLRAGFYRGPIRIDKRLAGTKESPTVIKAEAKWKAVVAGSPEHGVFVGEGADWVVIDGLEVMGARQDGIKVSADHAVVRNCYVHNNSSMGIAIHGRKDWVIENNLIEYNGQHPQLQHGIYADGVDMVVRNNVVRHNAGYGVQLYPLARNATVVNNLIYGQPRKGGLILQSPPGGGHNVVANNTIADNAYGISLYGGSGEVVANNIIAGPKPIVINPGAGPAVVEYNLCAPECAGNAHAVKGDAKFADPLHGSYYLAAGSAAIGAGSLERMPAADFWGRPRAKERYAGAFPYLPYLAGKEVAAKWHNGYAYRFHAGDPNMEAPDFWAAPPSSAWGTVRVTEREAVFENSRFRARYGEYMSKNEGPKDALVELRIKPGEENWGLRIDSRSANGSHGKSNRLSGVKLVCDGVDRKTVRLDYGDGVEVEEVTMCPDAPWLEITYFHHDVNIFDTAGQKGAYEIFGAKEWQAKRANAQTYPPYPESYCRKEWGAPGPLEYHGNYILGLYDPATGRGYGRVMPAEDVDVVKLLFERGFEMFPHYQPRRAQRAFKGYLFFVTGGAEEILSLGKKLAER